MKTMVWIDLDGVMVNLEKGLKTTMNFEFPKERTDYNREYIHNMWFQLHENHPTFWSTLEPTPYYAELYSAILAVCPTPHVLSATPEPYTGEQNAHCVDQKTRWVCKHLGLQQALATTITKSKLKQDVIAMHPNMTHILVDDHPGNIQRWNDAGGVGIHHTDIKKTLDALKGFV